MKIIKIICYTTIVLILSCVFFFSSVILVNSYLYPDKIPSFFGWKPFIVISNSMEDKVFTGDIAVTKEINVEKYNKNDIVAFLENDIVILHRIIDTKEVDGELVYITKGDNNKNPDDGYITKSQIEGIYKYRIPKLGNVAMYVQTPTGMLICVSIPMFIYFFLELVDDVQERRKLIKEERSKRDE